MYKEKRLVSKWFICNMGSVLTVWCDLPGDKNSSSARYFRVLTNHLCMTDLSINIKYMDAETHTS
jgi:hypothetical protein